MSQNESNPCRRCGTCCQKGGPGLHLEDRALVDSGRIPVRHLFTIRSGELARDDIKGTLAPVEAEIIKIKGRPGSWTCHYYDQANRGCRIYDRRPLECRALNCRDTQRIEAVVATKRLTRRDLLANIQGLWELVDDHERRCSHALLRSLADEGMRGGSLRQERAILEILRFDAHIRELTVKQGGMDARMLDFVFGRPLADTINADGIRLIREKGAYGLVRQPAET
jgi:Fe-S-cluster containining protein